MSLKNSSVEVYATRRSELSQSVTKMENSSGGVIGIPCEFGFIKETESFPLF